MARLVLALVSLMVTVVSAKVAYPLPTGATFVPDDGSITPGFECFGRPYGYYADIYNRCKVFHVCPASSNLDNQSFQVAFICDSNTIFDQSTLTCNREADSSPCSEAESHYERSNKYFGYGQPWHEIKPSDINEYRCVRKKT